MRRTGPLLALLFLASGVCLWAAGDRPGWKLVWSDEFDQDGALNAANWNLEQGGGGWGNNEKQFYTDRLENARVEGGELIIEARQETYQGNDYTSARITTQRKQAFQYGRVEMRAKLPRGRGIWPAFWMLADEKKHHEELWPHNGEIDIMEFVGFKPGLIHGTLHTLNRNHMKRNYRQAKLEVPTASEAYHVYAIEWYPDRIDFYVDDEQYGSFEKESNDWQDWPFDQEMFLILNCAVGGFWGGAKGIDDSIFPQQYRIDYVRVYQPESSE